MFEKEVFYEKLNIYLKTNFNNNTTSKNISYEVKNIRDEVMLNSILKDLKLLHQLFNQENNLRCRLMPFHQDQNFL